ncbi:MAG: PilZ domain-containing protein [Hahellaceae bacterium]|nr:PilZ domain-containing protein [Hahellaceae bacterium]
MVRHTAVRRYLEKRIKTRHKADNLEVQATFHGFLNLFRGQMKVDCVDFNRYGMAIETRRKLKKGDKLVFRFRGPYIHENDIPGFVTSVTVTENGYRYGIMFAYTTSQKAYNREVDNAVSRIEAIFSQANRTSL